MNILVPSYLYTICGPNNWMKYKIGPVWYDTDCTFFSLPSISGQIVFVVPEYVLKLKLEYISDSLKIVCQKKSVFLKKI